MLTNSIISSYLNIQSLIFFLLEKLKKNTYNNNKLYEKHDRITVYEL